METLDDQMAPPDGERGAVKGKGVTPQEAKRQSAKEGKDVAVSQWDR